MALVFLGRFVFNLVDTINVFTTLILVLPAPWMSILLIGYLTRRGHSRISRSSTVGRWVVRFGLPTRAEEQRQHRS